MSNNDRTAEMASHKNERLNEQRARIDELEAEVGRLRAVLDTLVQASRAVLGAKDVHSRLWSRLSSSISSAQDALSTAEDGQNE